MEWIYKEYTIKENEKGEFKISHENGTNLIAETLEQAKGFINGLIEIRNEVEGYRISEIIVFSFGKYKGQKIIDVIKKDCRYVNWCIKNVKGFAIPSYLKSKVREKMNYHAVGYDDPYGECLDEAIGGCWYGA